ELIIRCRRENRLDELVGTVKICRKDLMVDLDALTTLDIRGSKISRDPHFQDPTLPTSEAYRNRAIDRVYNGDYEGGIRDSTQAIALEPMHSAAYNTRGVANHSLGNYTAALRDFTRSIMLSSENEVYYNNRGIVHHDMMNYNASIQDYNRALDIN